MCTEWRVRSEEKAGRTLFITKVGAAAFFLLAVAKGLLSPCSSGGGETARPGGPPGPHSATRSRGHRAARCPPLPPSAQVRAAGTTGAEGADPALSSAGRLETGAHPSAPPAAPTPLTGRAVTWWGGALRATHPRRVPGLAEAPGVPQPKPRGLPETQRVSKEENVPT